MILAVDFMDYVCNGGGFWLLPGFVDFGYGFCGLWLWLWQWVVVVVVGCHG